MLVLVTRDNSQDVTAMKWGASKSCFRTALHENNTTKSSSLCSLITNKTLKWIMDRPLCFSTFSTWWWVTLCRRCMQKCTPSSHSVTCLILTKTETALYLLPKLLNIKFHVDLFHGSQAVMWVKTERWQNFNMPPAGMQMCIKVIVS
jgi:hypothetical protein